MVITVLLVKKKVRSAISYNKDGTIVSFCMYILWRARFLR